MKTYKNLFETLFDSEIFEKAKEKAAKGKEKFLQRLKKPRPFQPRGVCYSQYIHEMEYYKNKEIKK